MTTGVGRGMDVNMGPSRNAVPSRNMGPQTWVGSGALERLADLGLDQDTVEKVLRRADAEAALCTSLDPPVLEGLIRWGRATRFLREELTPFGWTVDNDSNIARTVHPGGDFAIVVASGDARTGIPGAHPAHKNRKGPATEKSVNTNGMLPFDFSPWETRSGLPQTWVLLVHTADDEFQVEVSLPNRMEEGRVTSWVERIILPSVPREHDPAEPVRPGDNPLPVDDVVVEVTRR
jgi:hypothetical protein